MKPGLPLGLRQILISGIIISLSLAGFKAEAEDGLAPEQVKISLSLRNIEITEALKFFSMKSGLNIVPTQKVSGRVTLTVENVPIGDVFDIMLRSNSLAYDKKGSIYNVMTEDEYKALYGKNFSDTRQVKVFRLKYSVPDQAFSLLDATKSAIGRLLVEPESGTVMIMDTPEKIAEAEKTLDALEQKGSIKMFNLKYAKASEVEEQLKSQLDLKKVGSVKADNRTNQIIVQTLPERMDNIENLIKGLDKKTKQVLIETKIIKIKLSNQLDTGIEWEGLFKVAKEYGMNYIGSYPFSLVQSSSATTWQSRMQVLQGMQNAGYGVGSYPFSGTTTNFSGGSAVAPGQSLHVGIVDTNHDFDVLVKYLQTKGKTKILSNPTITAVNNEEAKIHVGERRAYVTTTITSGASTTTTAEAVTYVDVGLQLSITPQINDDGYIVMKIKPEISSVIGNVTTSSNNLIPIIDTSTAETTVMAKDGSTVVLGGLGQEEKTSDSKGIPVLSNIPLLGFFFTSKADTSSRNELLIVLTPFIFEGDRMITPEGRERELHGVKAAKKFDVFREEIGPPVGDASSLANNIFAPKGFKPYSIGNPDKQIVPKQFPEAPTAINKEELMMPKGVRPYSQ